NCEKNIKYITMMFCDKYYYFKLYDHSGIKIDYDNFLYENSVKGELVRLVKADDELDDDTKAAIIAIGIKALTGEEYI
ncbi:MAG TPA: DNA repair exonuclease, partial [Eubacterium sp.]|nr:DNA repair exonuclease [Eubacterium sp.]